MDSKEQPSPLAVVLPQLDLSSQGLLAAFYQGKNPKTILAYQQDLKDFQGFLGAKTPEDACAFLLAQSQGQANALVLSYRQFLTQRGLSPATQNRRLAALKAFVKLARFVGLSSLTIELSPLPQETYRDTRGPGREGFCQMLDVLKERSDPKGIRDLAILRLLYDLALRRSEVISLDLRHVNLQRKTLSIQGKGRLERQIIGMAEETAEALTSWLNVRGKKPGPLFTTLDPAQKGDGRLSANGLYMMIKSLGEDVGITVRPHGLRHAAITDALDATNGDIRAVQRFSRHKDVRVICRYDDQRNDVAAEISRLVAKRSKPEEA